MRARSIVIVLLAGLLSFALQAHPLPVLAATGGDAALTGLVSSVEEEYLLAKQTNIRRVFVDHRTTPVTFWVGSNHGASIVKLEPVE